ncbi:hypothetical protein JP0135_01060 [Helicobacter pylori]|uniref:hypothetical protein n=3 Tax=Helicobacter pylori TaxID=210 RepID=UPI00026A80F2|nr:hypothetical protein [Helicobacter pylori]EJB26021.1 hypothetical protein HPCPY6271_0537 [Helicobacter pylori CPY6271]BAW36047.1 uncharacterized protein HPF13_0383 [Helicobacter pylori]GHP93237.1 hypothetical protein JP0053_02590 [Helicobacter pylori]GHQ25677.1 hypothetical protein JP0061_04850 [Helicobacter pylori]GHQ39360.1 hypothetical protein JP0067_04410 [Helicobacter pylori]
MEAKRNFLQAFGMALSKMDADNKVDKIIKKLDFNGAIKTLRKIEIKPTLFNHYRNGYSVSNLNGNNPTTNEFKTQEPQRTKQ